MLCLSRKIGQTLKIGEDIEITVLSIGHGQVRLGITAPPHVPVHRSEIHERLVLEGNVKSFAK